MEEQKISGVKRRGFASMSPERRSEVAARGGKCVPKEARTFSKNRGLASECGRVGGKSIAPENRMFSRDPELAREAGRKGGSTPRRRMQRDQS